MRFATTTNGALVRLGAILVVVLLACALLSPLPFAQGSSATADTPARVSVRIPQVAGGRSVMLELTVKAVRNPSAANIGGAVRLARPGGSGVEVGRFSLFTAGAGDDQRFQFNVTSAVRQLELSGAAAEVEVTLIDRSNGRAPASAQLSVGSVQVDLR